MLGKDLQTPLQSVTRSLEVPWGTGRETWEKVVMASWKRLQKMGEEPVGLPKPYSVLWWKREDGKVWYGGNNQVVLEQSGRKKSSSTRLKETRLNRDRDGSNGQRNITATSYLKSARI